MTERLGWAPGVHPGSTHHSRLCADPPLRSMGMLRDLMASALSCRDGVTGL